MKAIGKTAVVFPFAAPVEQLDAWRDKLGKVKINSCLIIQNGRCVFEYYKNKKIESKPQNVHSVTKSVVSALVGIALEQGLIPSLDTPIAEFFPRLMKNQYDPRKQAITVDHLLTMTPGYDWPEFGEWQAFCQMFYAPHWVRYVLERPLLDNPGERMNYNTGATHLLAAIVQEASGMKAAAFAEKHLFKPLGITEYRWHEDPQGVNNGGSGLSLNVIDMAKFGHLYLREGRWGEKQVVPAEWVRTSTKARYLTYENIGHYARSWWASADHSHFFALGHGGQYIIVVPELDLVAVMTSELFDQSLLPLRLFRERVMPALRG